MTTVVGLLIIVCLSIIFIAFFHPKMCPDLDNKQNGHSSSHGNGSGPEVEDLHFPLEPSTHLQSPINFLFLGFLIYKVGAFL